MSDDLDMTAALVEKRGPKGRLEEAVGTHLLPTPRAQNGEERNQNIWARPTNEPQNLENALALLPTPTVMDMGGGRTPEEWEAWKQAMKQQHHNGNGHGRSLEQELLGASTSQPSDAGNTSPDQPPPPPSQAPTDDLDCLPLSWNG